MTEPSMADWRRVWRVSAPLFTTVALESLSHALRNDEPRLLQGATTTPPPLSSVQDWPVEAACLWGYCAVTDHGGWGEAKVGEVEEAFAKVCFQVDQLLQEPAGCRWLLNVYDDWPRSEMIANLLPEVERELASRAALVGGSA